MNSRTVLIGLLCKKSDYGQCAWISAKYVYTIDFGSFERPIKEFPITNLLQLVCESGSVQQRGQTPSVLLQCEESILAGTSWIFKWGEESSQLLRFIGKMDKGGRPVLVTVEDDVHGYVKQGPNMIKTRRLVVSVTPPAVVGPSSGAGRTITWLISQDSGVCLDKRGFLRYNTRPCWVARIEAR